MSNCLLLYSKSNRFGSLCKHNIKQPNYLGIVIASLLCIFFCLFLIGCKKTSEINSDRFKLEGASENWSLFAEIPSVDDHDEEFIRVSFEYCSAKSLFLESDIISFGMGTSVGSTVYTYSKTNGYLQSDYLLDPIGQDRVIYVSEDRFEVFFDIELIDYTDETFAEQTIIISITNQAEEERIEMHRAK